MNTFSPENKGKAYFDWNVLSYLHGIQSLPVGEMQAKVLCLRKVINDLFLRDDWIFPFSRAHFADIKQGDEKLISGKLKFLEQFTHGWSIYQDPLNNNEIYINKYDDASALFDYVYSQSNSSAGVSGGADDQIVEFLDPYQERLRQVIDDSAYLYPDNEYKILIKRLSECIGNPDAGLEGMRISKRIRHIRLKGIDIKHPQIKDISNVQDREELKKLVNQCLRKSSYPFSTYEEFFSLYNFNAIMVLSEYHKDIIKLMYLADLIGLSSEKLNKDTAFESLTTDLAHLTLALKCNMFITEDVNLLRKARFICKWLNIDTKVFNIDGFIEYVLSEILMMRNSQSPEKYLKRMTFQFTDSEGKRVRTYCVSSDRPSGCGF